MTTIRTMRARPWLAAAVGAGVVVVLLAAVPFPYMKTTGQQVTLKLGGALDPARVGQVAKEFKTAVGAAGVSVTGDATDGRLAYRITTSVPARARAKAAATAEAFAKALTARGYTASASTEPVRERVWGPMVAYAMDRVVTIDVDGGSPEQLEAQIRQQLAQAGITDANVTVTQSDGGKKIGIQITKDHSDGSSASSPVPEFHITKGGVPLGDQGARVEMHRSTSANGGKSMTMSIQQNGKTTEVEIPNAGTMSDADLAATVADKLRAAGIDLDVTVTNGRIMVKPKGE